MEDTLINFGSEIKSLGTNADGDMKFGAWLVLYGDPQNTDASNLRDYFTKSTDFDFEDGDKTTVYWNHGLDPELKRRKLGTATLHKKDAGVWMEGILKARDEYEAKIQDMIKAGKLGASSGVPSHLVERKNVGNAHEIVLWPLGKDASLTHTPAEWRTSAHALKSLEEASELPHFSELEAKAVTTATTAPPYPQQQSGVVDYPTRKPVLVGEDSDYSRCAACSAHNSPDATKCSECGALMAESGRKSVSDEMAAKLLKYWGEDALKKYDPEQPRNDKGEWDSGSSGGGSVAPSSGDNHVTQSAVSKMNVKEAKAKLKELRTAKKAHSEKMKTADRSDANYRSADGGWSKDVAASMALNEAILRLENHILIDPQTSRLRDARKSIAEQLELEDDETDTPETKHLTELTELLHDGIGFEAHSAKVLAAVEEFVERIDSLKTIRCEQDGRRWSAEKYQSLTEVANGLSEAADAIKAMAEAHAPRSATSEAAESEMMAQYHTTLARINGVAV